MAEKLLKRKPRKVASSRVRLPGVPPSAFAGSGRAVAPRPPQGKVVLVGTYKGRQLERWPGYYNYPLGEDEFLAAKSAKNGRAACPHAAESVGSRVPRDRIGRAVAPRPPQSAVGRDGITSPSDESAYARVNELWLFQGAKAGRFYSAKFVGVFPTLKRKVS